MWDIVEELMGADVAAPPRAVPAAAKASPAAMPAAAPPRPRVSPLEQWQANAKRMGAPAEMVLIVTVCVVLAGTPFWSFRGYAMLLGAPRALAGLGTERSSCF